MKYVLFFLVLFAFVGCSKPVQEDVMHDAVNQIIGEMEGKGWEAEGSPSYGYLVDRSSAASMIPITDEDKLDTFLSEETIRKYFSKEDIEAFKQQALKYKNMVYDKNKITAKKIISHNELDKLIQNRNAFWKEYESRYGKTGFYDISFPLFSADGTKMLVAIEHCRFGSSSSGYVCIFNKVNGRWVVGKPLYSYLS
ncbi:hypothetical protein R1T16_11185 [Flavobacterium sp. DG1-102-2]|uniref:hypothetical protein n=1 Tax=Flavobacterium sp. DG1-102-2 TaxID=3081663 RepID=UPI002949D460|nr:hypothetical protein [Flavobacterium sp. DG1-102-2]MDV6168992.1 hypothetical protein [Flavobacterium sp. DG1-102-2]